MNPVAIRLLNQQLCSPQFSTPEEVVAHLSAMQAQEYRLMRWAVSMRTKKPSSEAFRQAFDSGRIVRLHLMRGTWQLVSGDDYWWMLDLLAEKSRRVIRGWMTSNHIFIPDDECVRIREIIARCAEDCGSATKEDFVNALAAQGIKMDDHRLSYHIRMAELSGTLCSGKLLPMKATYSLAESRIPHREHIDREEALARLTRKYFFSRCPATLEDFVWWSGLSVRDCRKGVSALGDELYSVKWHNREFFIHQDARHHGVRHRNLLLLPPYDEYLIGYKSRDIALPETHRHHAHNSSGIFYPIILRDGIACGNWKPFEKQMHCQPFDPADNLEGIEMAWEKYQRYLGY